MWSAIITCQIRRTFVNIQNMKVAKKVLFLCLITIFLSAGVFALTYKIKIDKKLGNISIDFFDKKFKVFSIQGHLIEKYSNNYVVSVSTYAGPDLMLKVTLNKKEILLTPLNLVTVPQLIAFAEVAYNLNAFKQVRDYFRVYKKYKLKYIELTDYDHSMFLDYKKMAYEPQIFYFENFKTALGLGDLNYARYLFKNKLKGTYKTRAALMLTKYMKSLSAQK